MTRGAVSAVALLTALTPVQARPQCIGSDMNGELAADMGDMEIVADTNGDILWETDSGQQVIVAAIGGQLGFVKPGSRTVVAGNFNGDPIINGPKWVVLPDGRYGLIYPGGDGVHGAFRAPGSPWNAFTLDVGGNTVQNLSPPLLPSGGDNNAYPGSAIPSGLWSYQQFNGSCQGMCTAAVNEAPRTSVYQEMLNRGYAYSWSNLVPQPAFDGYVYIGACKLDNTACGLYEAQVDNATGGLVSGTLQQIISLSGGPAKQYGSVVLPGTGDTILWVLNGATELDVFKQPATGGAAKFLAAYSVPAGLAHFRGYSNNANQAVLHAFIRAGNPGQGSYTQSIVHLPGGYSGSPPVLIDPNNGVDSKLIWAPNAPTNGQWWFFYRPNMTGPLTRCIVHPSGGN